MLKFDFSNETKTKISKKFFYGILDNFYKILGSRIDKMLDNHDGQIDLVLVNNPAIQNLNNEYRKKNKPTDVISFAYLEVTEFEVSGGGDVIVGDIFISVDMAKNQAKEKGHSLKREMEILFVHGLLHLFGFDHKTDKQEKEMEEWAEKVLT